MKHKMIPLPKTRTKTLKVKNKPIYSVQYHPEASPGPHDTYGFFDSFYNAIMKIKKKNA